MKLKCYHNNNNILMFIIGTLCDLMIVVIIPIRAMNLIRVSVIKKIHELDGQKLLFQMLCSLCCGSFSLWNINIFLCIVSTVAELSVTSVFLSVW